MELRAGDATTGLGKGEFTIREIARLRVRGEPVLERHREKTSFAVGPLLPDGTPEMKIPEVEEGCIDYVPTSTLSVFCLDEGVAMLSTIGSAGVENSIGSLREPWIWIAKLPHIPELPIWGKGKVGESVVIEGEMICEGTEPKIVRFGEGWLLSCASVDGRRKLDFYQSSDLEEWTLIEDMSGVVKARRGYDLSVSGGRARVAWKSDPGGTRRAEDTPNVPEAGDWIVSWSDPVLPAVFTIARATNSGHVDQPIEEQPGKPFWAHPSRALPSTYVPYGEPEPPVYYTDHTWGLRVFYPPSLKQAQVDAKAGINDSWLQGEKD